MAIGIDVGGTKISGVLADADGRVLGERRVVTRLDRPDAPVEQVIAICAELAAAGAQPHAATTSGGRRMGAQRVRPEAIGIGVPGLVDPTGRDVVWAPNLPGWRNLPLAERVEAALGLPARLVNDGHAGALAEAWLGAGRGARVMAYITVGTGIGGGVVIDGRIHRGATGTAGAFGWLWAGRPPATAGGGAPRSQSDRAVPSDDEPLAGSRYPELGPLERRASGKAIAALAGSDDAGILFDRARGGHPAALALTDAVAAELSSGLASIIATLDPDVIVLGGGVMRAADLLLPRVRETIRRVAQPYAVKSLRVEPAALVERAGPLGAARMALTDVPAP